MAYQPHPNSVFFSRIHRNAATGCWDYDGPKCGGGLHYRSFRREMAHRFSYKHHKGPIPKGMQVRHTCDNPICVNPEHLLIGSPQDNMDDKVARGRATAMKGVNNPNAKLTPAQVVAIYHDPRSCHVTGRAYGVSAMIVSKIRRRILWKEVVV